MTNYLRLSLSLVMGAVLLTGCGTSQPTKVAETVEPEYTLEERTRMQVESLLNRAESSPLQAVPLRLNAANLLLSIGKRDAALAILDAVPLAQVPPALRYESATRRARSALDANNPDQAIRFLSVEPSSWMTDESQARILDLRAQAYRQQGDSYNEALALMPLTLQPNQDVQALNNRIAELLANTDTNTLYQAVQSQEYNYVEQGWFEYLLAQRQNPQIDAQAEAINQWKRVWADHPVGFYPPEVQGSVSFDLIEAQNIAVVLPQSGRLAKHGAAIREGLMAGYFSALQKGERTPNLRFYDENQIQSIEMLVNLVNDGGYDLVIGPLDKPMVNALNQQAALKTPVLALNYAPADHVSHLYQFGLSLEDEATQAAQRIWNDGHKFALSMTANTAWGMRIHKAFEEAFTALGGTVANQVSFTNTPAFSGEVGGLLGTDRSKERARSLENTLGERLVFEEYRRQDATAVFLSALPQDARQLKPILAFHFAGDLPIYATSHVFEGTINAARDNDLSGIRFIALPWNTDEFPSEEKRALAYKYNDVDSRFGRLYALGVDAYNLYPYLNQLAASPETSIEGVTGELSIMDLKKVNRQMPWFVYRQGTPTPLSSQP